MLTGFFEHIFVKAYVKYVLSELTFSFLLLKTNRVALAELFSCHPLNAHVSHLLSPSPPNKSLQNFGIIYLKCKIAIFFYNDNSL